MSISFISNAQYSTFNHGGLNREYIYHEPLNLAANSPLIFVMHGYSEDASTIEWYSGFNAIADSVGFAVCYPRGINDFLGNRFFNVGYDFHIGIETVDDLSFLEALATHLQTIHGLDSNRTYATGLSNGGDMCYKIACQGSGVFKATAAVAGMMLEDIQDSCTNNISIPILEIHGTDDNVTYYDGDMNNTGGWGAYAAIDTMMFFFANRNSYTSFQSLNLPDINSSDGSTVTCLKYTNPSNCNDVWLYRVVGGGHDWPGSSGNMHINSSVEIWNFFQTVYCSGFTIIDEGSQSEFFNFFPNPFNNILNINISKEATIELFNNNGSKIKEIICSERSVSIDLSDLSSGIYILRATINKEQITKKIIKQ